MSKSLKLASAGPCEGHACDNCPMCRRGTCCRRDNPSYKLPVVGEWSGALHGKLGKLECDGTRVQCHCCGEYFLALGHHILSAHNLLACEYKALFGLKRRGLLGPAVRKEMEIRGRRKALEELRLYPERLRDCKLTPEQMSQRLRGRPLSLEVKGPTVERLTLARPAALAAIARKKALGIKHPPADASHLQSAEMKSKAKERQKALLADPARRARWIENLARAKGRGRVRVCIQCGRDFVKPPWERGVVVWRGAKLCSRECFNEFKRQQSTRLAISRRPGIGAKISAGRRAAAARRGLNP